MIWAVLFWGLIGLGLLCGFVMWRADVTPFERTNPQRIFRLVHREDRAAYSRIMRRTWTVQMRDLSRKFERFGRVMVKVLTPAMEALAAALKGTK